jgi:recombination protein RecT
MSNNQGPQLSDRERAIRQRISTVKDLFGKASGDLRAVAPKHITPERMIKVAVASLSRVPNLAECTPHSLLIALMTATELGLEPNTPLGHSYIVPLKNKGVYEAQFWPGYRGLVYLAFQSGEVIDIRSSVVKQLNDKDRDHWFYKDGRGGIQFEWTPSEHPDREDWPVRCVYAAATMRNDREHLEVMTRAQINAIYKASPAGRGGFSSPWDAHWEEMARKTVIKRLCKHLPLATEKTELLARAIEVDNAQSGDDENGVIATLASSLSESSQEAAQAATASAPNIPAETPQLPQDTRVKVPEEAPPKEAAPAKPSRAEEARSQIKAPRKAQEPPSGVDQQREAKHPQQEVAEADAPPERVEGREPGSDG